MLLIFSPSYLHFSSFQKQDHGVFLSDTFPFQYCYSRDFGVS